MKAPRFITALAAFLLLSAIVSFAAAPKSDATPTGTWKWEIGRPGSGVEQTLTLQYKDGKLSGTLMGVQGTKFSLPDTPINDASFEGGVLIKFSVTREFGGVKVTTKYEGKLEGDTITGISVRPAPGTNEMRTQAWNAKRVAGAPAK